MWRRDSAAGGLYAEIDEVNSWCVDALLPPGAVELPIEPLQPRSVPIRVSKLTTTATGFLFAETGHWAPPDQPGGDAAGKKRRRKDNGAPHAGSAKRRSQGRHRIKPPGDVVKLQDRLYYLLQPPLDLLVGSGQLNFPFDPFPYQLDGIAFLFPRYAAVLADEMGLGKPAARCAAGRCRATGELC